MILTSNIISLVLNENHNVRSLEVVDVTQTNITAQILLASLTKAKSWQTLNSLSLTKYNNEEDFGGALKAIGQVSGLNFIFLYLLITV